MTGGLRSGPPFDRIIVSVLVVFVASLTVEWISLAGVAGDGGVVKPFHLVGLGLAGLCAARWGVARLVLPVLRRHSVIFGSYILMLAIAATVGLVHDQPYRSHFELLRQGFYLGTSMVVAGLLIRIASRSAPRALSWTGVVSVIVLLVLLVASLTAQRVNPLTVLLEALAKRDPDIVSYRLLRSAFRTQEDFAQIGANLRHKVFGALLLGVLVGFAYLPLGASRRWMKRIQLGAGVLGFALVVISLSRSVTLCLVGTLLLLPLRALVRMRSAPRQVALLGAGVTVTIMLALSPVGELLHSRFSGTGSYEGRLTAVTSGFAQQFEAAALVGADKSEVEKSPHNLILDAWLAGGVLAASSALLMLVAFARLWLREVRRYVTGAPGWVLPVHQLWLLGVGIVPLVRAFTSGNQAHMVEWTAIGIFVGLFSANQHRAARLITPVPAVGARSAASRWRRSEPSRAPTRARS